MVMLSQASCSFCNVAQSMETDARQHVKDLKERIDDRLLRTDELALRALGEDSFVTVA